MRTRVLAEPGSTAEGRLDLFRRLIDVAAEAGATALKNQWTSSPARMCERRRAPDYLDAYRRIAYPVEWHAKLAEWCREAGLEYGCAVYLPEDVWMVAPFCAFLKVSSFEAGDVALLSTARATGKQLIVSTGMLGEEDVYRLAHHADRHADVILACTSAYPAPWDQMHLATITHLTRCWPSLLVGLSDHSRCLIAGAVAVGAGAKLIEVHFRLMDTDPHNPDYGTALHPGELGAYIEFVRQAEVLMGDGVKQPQPAEAAMLPYRVQP